MKLLIVTQIVDKNDPILGFFHRWVIEFAKHCERVTVICLKEGQHDLPENVHVLSLGKEQFESRSDPGLVIPAEAGIQRRPLQATSYKLQARLRYALRFLHLIWRERKHYDAVFVHMNPEYVVLGAPLWRVLRKRIALWYTHKSVNSTLRFATRFAHVIFTASKESFRIESPKVQVVGHGIDTALFAFREKPLSSPLRLISVGRISRIKRQDLAIETLAELGKHDMDATLTLVGVPLTDADRVYEHELQELATRVGVAHRLIWRGAVPNTELPTELAKADILLHTSETGSLDKVVLEAMAVGVRVVTTSEPVHEVFTNLQECIELVSPTPELLAERIFSTQVQTKDKSLVEKCCAIVKQQHSLPSLVNRILDCVLDLRTQGR